MLERGRIVLTAEASLRVLHVYKTYFPDTMGGIEKVLLQLTQGLFNRNVQSRFKPDRSLTQRHNSR